MFNLRWQSYSRFLVVVAASLIGACGSDSTTAPTKANTAPTGASLTISPAGAALVGIPVTFSASATDADGDSLSYAWNFGDGTTGSGQSTTHVYANVSTNTVTLTVSDGKGGSATASGSVRSANVTGNWIQPEDFPLYGYALFQNGSVLTGTRIDRRGGNKAEPGDITGNVIDSRHIRFQTFYPGTRDTDTATATLDANLTSMTYTLQDGRTSTLSREQ